jgi:hypothetical protein
MEVEPGSGETRVLWLTDFTLNLKATMTFRSLAPTWEQG